MSDTTITPEHTEDTPNERRALLRKLAIGGAGAAAGVAMLKSGTASAADGDPQSPRATQPDHAPPTIVDFTPGSRPDTAGPSAFSVGGYVPRPTAPFPAGVGGYGDATIPNGVHGSTTARRRIRCRRGQPVTCRAAATDPVPTAQAVASLDGAHMLFLAGAA